ncbi:MAG: mechanosensitive ion channel [Gemmatimonadetes bacterium]|nr:mechanosensitive ion channel [Gemmatimonadota bacterium]
MAITGLFLILWGVPEDAPAQPVGAAVAGAPAASGTVTAGVGAATASADAELGGATSVSQVEPGAGDEQAAGEQATDTAQEAPGSPLVDTAAGNTRADPGRSVEEATSTVRQFAVDFTTLLPKILIALGLLLAAGIIVRLVRAVLRRVLGEWERADAVTAIAGIVIWLLAFGIALSVIAGDTRTLIGSVGLLGLALSWALQAPIESFAGWLLNSFKGYYRVGDRIAVGEVFGDVYRIDFMNTTVWEAGGPDKPVQGAQPTGALITFPNSEVLRANIVNYTRGFPYVWDEIQIGVSNESDLGYAMRVIAAVARETIGPSMQGPVETYRALLDQENLAYDVSDEPQVYLSPTDSWTDVVVRYLVSARERRKWSSALHLRIGEELAKPEHRQRVQPSYPTARRLNMLSDAEDQDA